MDLARHPELLDRLAAAYALGTLRGGARRRFEALARQSPAVRTAALIWQERFAAMTELQPADTPSPNVWKRIENLLAAELQPRRARACRRGAARARLVARRGLGRWPGRRRCDRGVAEPRGPGGAARVPAGRARSRAHRPGGPQCATGHAAAGPAGNPVRGRAGRRPVRRIDAGHFRSRAQHADDQARGRLPGGRRQVAAAVGAAAGGRAALAGRARRRCRRQAHRRAEPGRTRRRWRSAWSPRAACRAKAGRPGRCCSRGRCSRPREGAGRALHDASNAPRSHSTCPASTLTTSKRQGGCWGSRIR